MLFQRDGKLYRLTTDGQGHNFLSEQSTNGNPMVVRVIQNFGPVAPSDDDYLSFNDEYYWLAEVEWLQPVDAASVEAQSLEQLLSDLTDDDHVEPHQRETFLERCKAAASVHTKYRDLLNTLIEAANYLPKDDGTASHHRANAAKRVFLPACAQHLCPLADTNPAAPRPRENRFAQRLKKLEMVST